MDNLLETVSRYVISFLTENLSDKLTFHSINHTYEVVEAVKEIGMQSSLSAGEMRLLITAAWFHDCGYANTYIDHEEESKKIAENFLDTLTIEKDFIKGVLQCIESTKYSQKPSSLIEKILCDADFYHFTRTTYPKYEKAIRQELEIFLGLQYTDEEWSIKNCNFLNEHCYHTEYGTRVLAQFKEVNIQLVNLKTN
ncbi:putative metal-dependent HD superfamily phosphohydrolase [Chryseobacterium sp. H1D6B]|uniref:HD domain-containing protein n=1 Tax=Chryseobacterium sp. H1D6B TaxID=2940588 RepID=UPI0015CA3041|nr:HD domain-containing protein [Chryseobacterium sp. H1D6B]MDH6253849.1 putative metal-dependent HD superfamily phosphohydrolase [Chryseobacterium sp. H1D6B]